MNSSDLEKRLKELGFKIDALIEAERLSLPTDITFSVMPSEAMPNWPGGKYLAFGIIALLGGSLEADLLDKNKACQLRSNHQNQEVQ